MAKIKWKGVIEDESEFPSATLPINAIKLDTETDMKKMQLKALPFMIPSVLLCILCMFTKTLLADKKVIDFKFLFIGVLIGIILIVAHELLHAIAYPKNAIVYIGIMPKKLTAVALSSSPVKRNRFIFISILPIILGIIPLVIFCFSDINLLEFNGFIFGLSIMGMTSVYPDLYNIYHIIKKVPSQATIINDKNDTYYI